MAAGVGTKVPFNEFNELNFRVGEVTSPGEISFGGVRYRVREGAILTDLVGQKILAVRGIMEANPLWADAEGRRVFWGISPEAGSELGGYLSIGDERKTVVRGGAPSLGRAQLCAAVVEKEEGTDDGVYLTLGLGSGDPTRVFFPGADSTKTLIGSTLAVVANIAPECVSDRQEVHVLAHTDPTTGKAVPFLPLGAVSPGTPLRV